MSHAVEIETTSQKPQTIYLKEYQPPEYSVETLHLNVNIHKTHVDVTATSQIIRAKGIAVNFMLQGNQQELQSVQINGIELSQEQLEVSETGLTIKASDVNFDRFELRIHTKINPFNNTSLEGLYDSKGMLCTQCEAEGFRCITYYVDRPDNMAVFTTRIEADKDQYPVLLANGNLVETSVLDGHRHAVVWHDPFPKPSYLFALVAGQLAVTQDTFITQSGREVTIAFYTDAQDQDKISFAMTALKKSMRWDEERYGREYDLDIFMVVAVSHFNMGAMENKGLNIFNTRCVLASPDTTTDAQYASVESIIAHEYFHNWSGNRITCRDWFQLSLKEGFTVFRDQHFSMEIDSWLEHRVGAVKVMRSIQFAEDAGPMAHPVRPQSYIEINNFYTVTVYDKGAEVVRLYHTLLGPEAFRAGTDRYFEQFDGQAVTTEDFMNAVTQGSDIDCELFQRWYDQPGTPVVTVHRNYDEETKELRLRFEQHYPELPNWKEPRMPVIIPVALGFIAADGSAVELTCVNESFSCSEGSTTNGLFVFKEAHAEICFTAVPKGAVPSLLRGFSAPVILKTQLSLEELALLVAHDEDSLNRWDAAQQMMNFLILQCDITVEPEKVSLLIESLRKMLVDESMSPESRALICQLPGYAALEQVQVQATGAIEVDQIIKGQDELRKYIAHALESELKNLVSQADNVLKGKSYNPASEDRGWRSIRNLAYYYLASLKTPDIEEQLFLHVQNSNNLTDRLAGCRSLLHCGYSKSKAVLDQFSNQFGQEELAMNAWFEVQASNPIAGALERVRQLQLHELYDSKSPNHVRAVVGAFCRGNPKQFHQLDMSGYQFLAETVLHYNESNPQLAARLLGPLISWRQYDSQRQVLMQKSLQVIMDSKHLAPDVFEIVSKSLAQ